MGADTGMERASTPPRATIMDRESMRPRLFHMWLRSTQPTATAIVAMVTAIAATPPATTAAAIIAAIAGKANFTRGKKAPLRPDEWLVFIRPGKRHPPLNPPPNRG